MRRRAFVLSLALAIVALTPLAGVADNGVDDRRFICRASVVRVQGYGVLSEVFFEPVVANEEGDPCVAETQPGFNPIVLPANLGSLEVIPAQTTFDPKNRATASTAVARVRLTAPGVPVIEVDVLSAQANATCPTAGTTTLPDPELSGSSQVVGLRIDGREVAVDGHTHITLAPLAVLHLNHQTRNTRPSNVALKRHAEGELIQRALWLELHGLADVVIAEAIAGYHGTPCNPIHKTGR